MSLLDEQTRDIEEHASSHGYTHHRTLSRTWRAEHQGAGRGSARCRLTQGPGRFDLVIGHGGPDRLARSGSAMGDLAGLHEEGGEIGIETVQGDRSTYGGTAGLLAEVSLAIEREAFAERSALMGKKGSCSCWTHPCGPAPVWLHKGRRGPAGHRCEHEAIVVGRLFHEYANGRQGVPTIMKVLEARVRVQANSRKRSTWMLQEPRRMHRAEWSYDGVAIPCPAIVSQALWDKTQDLLDQEDSYGGPRATRRPTTYSRESSAARAAGASSAPVRAGRRTGGRCDTTNAEATPAQL